MIEYVSEEHNDVWKIISRGNYSEDEMADIEKMYNFMAALKEFSGNCGGRVMQAIELFSESYCEEFRVVAKSLSSD